MRIKLGGYTWDGGYSTVQISVPLEAVLLKEKILIHFLGRMKLQVAFIVEAVYVVRNSLFWRFER